MKRVVVSGTGGRLDVLIASDAISRSQAAKLIREGQVQVNGVVVTKPSFVPNIGDEVVLSVHEVADDAPKAEDLPIFVIYEDEALAVINKPAGLVVHPGSGNERGTLVNALLHHMDSLSTAGGADRPGIVHRLDKDTSGLLLIAKQDAAHQALSKALAARQIKKHYLAVVAGQMKEDHGSYEGPIARSPRDRKKMAVVEGGRDALTRWHLLHQDARSALVLVELVTGRTHQIRVHFSHDHHPVLGDPLYGHKNMPKAPRLMLHAFALRFEHPISGQMMRFHQLPEEIFKVEMDERLRQLIGEE
ncbi:MAG: RluA family pseudouridine synthase [Christensenellales bacterium]|jgi:23S rRNA pseudouridine1911/1915/1917 synthase